MKDDKLEKEFREYFGGAETPCDITGDAKKYVRSAKVSDDKKNYVRSEKRLMPKFLKFASVAASFALVFAVGLAVALNFEGKSGAAPDGDISQSGPSSTDPGASEPDADVKPDKPSDVPDGDSDEASQVTIYTDADLKYEEESARYLSQLDKSLKFIEELADSDSAHVARCKAGYLSGSLALVAANVTIEDGSYRDETDIFVEFTNANKVYDKVANYPKGSKNTFRDAVYYLTERAVGDGYEFKLYIKFGGVKYYFDISSSDSSGYMKYVQMIIK